MPPSSSWRARFALAVLAAAVLLPATAFADEAADSVGPADELAYVPDEEPLVLVKRPVGGGDVSIGLRGAVQTRVNLPLSSTERGAGDGALAPDRGLSLRRLRLGVDGELLPTVRFHTAIDAVDALVPASRRSPLVYGYGTFDLRLTQLSVGLMRLPFSRHALVDETRQLFLEPPTAWRADRMGIGVEGAVPSAPVSILPDRRVGAQFHEEVEGFAFGFGVFSGGAGAPEPTSSTTFAGRLEIGPFGSVPREGAFFAADYEAEMPRLSLSLGGLRRTAAAGAGSRAFSAALSAAYKGLFSSVELVTGDGRIAEASPWVPQRALTVDVAYRFPLLAQGLELGVRGDTFRVGDSASVFANQKSLAAVVNLYVLRHRVKASTLLRAVRDDAVFSRPSADGERRGGGRAFGEAIVEFTVGF
jgi:hypothetical protein